MESFKNWAKAAIAYFVSVGIRILIVIGSIIGFIYVLKRVLEIFI